jgi:hypothetical protein
MEMDTGRAPDGDEWFCERGDFWGTLKQLCLCAKCGKNEIKRYDEPRHYSGISTPHLHMICDECYASLADEEPHRDSDRSGEAGETPLGGSTVGESAGRSDSEGIAQRIEP